MSEETWHLARLIPTSGISGAQEQERRATSALLAVLMSVREFGRAVTQPYGAPAGRVECFIEVPFELGDKKLFPDGLVRVARGQTVWTALVEVKTGTNDLDATQLENYLDIAKANGFDAVLTISNQIPPPDGSHPTKVDRRKLRKVALHHLSWMNVLTLAVVQKEHRGVSDVDQAWILGELIRYLEHPRSGALEFEDMGSNWVAVRDAVGQGTLRSNDKGLPEVVGRFDALIQYVALKLGMVLGQDVTQVLTRAERADGTVRSQSQATSLATDGILCGGLRIPGAIAPVIVTADLRAGKVSAHLEVDAPREGRPATRVRWLLRQLKDAPDGLRLEAFVMHGRGEGASALLGAVREDPGLLVDAGSKEIRAFRLVHQVSMGSKRGRGRGGFIDSVSDCVNDFYGLVVQHLRAWQPSAPRMRSIEPSESESEVPVDVPSTALSSQDPSPADDGSAGARRRVQGDSLAAYVEQNGSRWA